MPVGYEYIGEAQLWYARGLPPTRELVAYLLVVVLIASHFSSLLVAPNRATAEPCAAVEKLSPRAQPSDRAYREFLFFMPVPTCDVLLLTPAHNATLLFKRANRPVQGVWYSLGGRVLKNETLRACAVRKLLAEFGLRRREESLLHAGTMEEHFPDSAFDGINSHCINSVFACVLSPAELRVLPDGSASAGTRTAGALDGQHSRARWFAVDDPALHPYVATKLDLVRVALARQAWGAAGVGGRRLALAARDTTANALQTLRTHRPVHTLGEALYRR
ncbi:hypothetical protein KFE25_012135 [Diacronema lutheri]|uniref:Nudix hydrolase domain-containing protein n=1 Tax=Diacronema lutheri TaxID=2081491 RepID=A0A8J5XG52_DIALT|nr:hypothetical protein KFE25_012135 [Diacronema lutheri]